MKNKEKDEERSKSKSKSKIEKIYEELNRVPLFMTKYDDTDGKGGENLELEALKTLLHDGDPVDVALNFKEQGNESFKKKKYDEAIKCYEQGIEVRCQDQQINTALVLNRSACYLHLKKYYKCIDDCELVLQKEPGNLKAKFRLAKSLYKTNKHEKAMKILMEQAEQAKQAEQDDFKTLLEEVRKDIEQKKSIEIKAEAERRARQQKHETTKKMLKLKNWTNVELKTKLNRFEPQYLEMKSEKIQNTFKVCLSCLALYPVVEKFDFIERVDDFSSIENIFETIFESFCEYHGQTCNYSSVDCYVETLSGSLAKIEMKKTICSLLSLHKPPIPLFNLLLKIYFVQKIDSDKWIGEWNVKEALKKRKLHIN